MGLILAKGKMLDTAAAAERANSIPYQDCDGSIVIPYWRYSARFAAEIEAGLLVKMNISAEEYQGKMQLANSTMAPGFEELNKIQRHPHAALRKGPNLGISIQGKVQQCQRALIALLLSWNAEWEQKGIGMRWEVEQLMNNMGRGGYGHRGVGAYGNHNSVVGSFQIRVRLDKSIPVAAEAVTAEAVTAEPVAVEVVSVEEKYPVKCT
mmetsp:Transcript_13297/g.21724  ORF Transcript_13297/g.21724 Transcript_13297/m.21724 type:complete len:208 (+) Transcript_13297:393-1016(+)